MLGCLVLQLSAAKADGNEFFFLVIASEEKLKITKIIVIESANVQTNFGPIRQADLETFHERVKNLLIMLNEKSGDHQKCEDLFSGDFECLQNIQTIHHTVIL